jgi:hypothetical protein
MSVTKEAREAILAKIIEEIGNNPDTFSSAKIAKRENVTIQSIYRYLKKLENDGKVVKVKHGNKNFFSLAEETTIKIFERDGLEEDNVWRNFAMPFFNELPKIAKDNLMYAFTEILNNAIDHSEGSSITISLMKNGYIARAAITDDGVGIFTKVSDALHLEDKRFAILELAKGKFTTEPESHTGEGIFFSSKVVDSFAILSDGLVFLGNATENETYMDSSPFNGKGTTVFLDIKYSHSETCSAVFDKFTQVPETYGFSKTIVPVRLLEYKDEAPLVVSRSQAKRLMVRFEKFENIILDFNGIDEIGQGFADELFRVFPKQHPNTKLAPINCSDAVLRMIKRVTTNQN